MSKLCIPDAQPGRVGQAESQLHLLLILLGVLNWKRRKAGRGLGTRLQLTGSWRYTDPFALYTTFPHPCWG